MRLRPQKTCIHSGVSGICENCGERDHNQRDQERSGSIQHYADTPSRRIEFRGGVPAAIEVSRASGGHGFRGPDVEDERRAPF
jgi:hypothetical protein